MLALQFHPSESDFILKKDIPKPTLDEENDDVLIKVEYAGLCGTDVHIVKGEFGGCSIIPVTLGHEFSGVVVGVGRKDQVIQLGAKVAIDPNSGCMKCSFCLTGKYHFCRGNIPIGVKRDGGFARYCKVPLALVHVLPPSVSLQQGALCEPMSCILHGWNRLKASKPIESSTKVLILGAGIIGNLWMCLLHYFGLRNVIVSEPSYDRRLIAKGLDLGFEITNPNEIGQLMPKDRFEAENEGVDIVIDCTGVPAALEKAIQWTKMGATIMVFGCAPVGKSMKICPEEIFAKELTILGTKINPYTFPEAAALIANMGSKYIDYKKLGIGQHKLEDHEDALNKLQKGKISKIIFELQD